MLFSWEGALRTVLLVLLECLKHHIMQVGILLGELRRKATGESQHVLIYQHLAVAAITLRPMPMVRALV